MLSSRLGLTHKHRTIFKFISNCSRYGQNFWSPRRIAALSSRKASNMQFRTLVTSTSTAEFDSEKISSSTEIVSSAPSSLGIFNIEDYIESVQQTGRVAVLFSDSAPVLGMVDLLYVLKDFPGMSWTGTILVGTLLARVLIGLPVSVMQQRAIGRLEQLKPEFETLAKDLRSETALAIRKFNWDEKTARRQFTKSYKKHWRKIVEENNCHPMKSLALTFVQLPFWICFSSALRNVVYALPLPRLPDKLERWIQIHSEGTPWVESLVLPDPIVFPAVFLVSNLLNIEYSQRLRPKLKNVPKSKLVNVLPWVLRGGIVFIAYFATSVPSAVSMYWATSSSIAFAQNVLMSRESVKNFFGIPPSHSPPPASPSSTLGVK